MEVETVAKILERSLGFWDLVVSEFEGRGFNSSGIDSRLKKKKKEKRKIGVS